MKEWGIFLLILIILYSTGLHTQVAAFTQRIVLSTGIITAGELPDDKKIDADYNMQLKSLDDGEVLDFTAYKGKVVFVNFWASWCAPCIAEMPNIQGLYEKIDSEDIKFVMISLDKTQYAARNFLKKKEFTFPSYYPVSYLPDVYKSEVIPTTFVISKDGKIVSRKEGMANYDKTSFRNFLLRLAGDS